MRDATFFEKAHLRITFISQIKKTQFKYLNNKNKVCKTVMIAKHEQGMAASLGVMERMSSHLHAIAKKWASKEEQAAVS